MFVVAIVMYFVCVGVAIINLGNFNQGKTIHMPKPWPKPKKVAAEEYDAVLAHIDSVLAELDEQPRIKACGCCGRVFVGSPNEDDCPECATWAAQWECIAAMNDIIVDTRGAYFRARGAAARLASLAAQA